MRDDNKRVDRRRLFAFTLGALLILATALGAQGPDSSASRSPLERVVSLHLAGASVEAALRAISSAAGVRLSYSSDVLPVERRVTIARDQVTVGAALRDVLRGTDLDVVVTPGGYIVLVTAPSRSRADTAGGGDRVESDISSAAAPHVIDRVIVMGTPVAGAPERGLSAAVTVIDAERIARLGVRRMDELFRLAVPGIVVWDMGASSPLAQLGAVRGSSSFSANYLKTYVDGVEIASPQMLFAVDPRGIERIEVIRGPQGSALYGSDAINGVVQIVTKKGRLGVTRRPQLDATVSGGLVESRYVDGASAVQDHGLVATSAGRVASSGAGGSYEREGPYVPGGRSQHLSVFGGAQALAGPVLVESSARYYGIRYIAPPNPLLATFPAAGVAVAPTPIRVGEALDLHHEGVGATANYQTTARWRQTLVVGYDHYAGTSTAQRVPTASPDILLGVSEEHASKGSLRYSSTIQVPHGAASASTIIVGVEHTRSERGRVTDPSPRVGTAGGGGVSLPPSSIPAGATLPSPDSMRNTGYFAQWKLDVGDALYFTAGVRAEENNTFGEGHVFSPMLGAAYAHDVGPTTVKLRWGFGRGIRPQASTEGRAQFSEAAVSLQLANPALAPESQQGFEGGVEIYSSDRLSLRATAFSQIADGLIQNVVTIPTTSGPASSATSFQRQNVGKIANAGLELEGSARGSVVQADAALSFTSSRVRRLVPSYTGDLRVGDRVPEIPSTSGQASVSVVHSGFAGTLGTTYIGSWIGYDWLAYYNPPGGKRRASLRDYWIRYPALVKPYVSLAQRLTADMSLFLRVDNLSNVQRNERDNMSISAGRTTAIGLRYAR